MLDGEELCFGNTNNDSWLELEVLMIKDEVIEEQKQNSTDKTDEFNFSNSAEQNLNYEEPAVF